MKSKNITNKQALNGLPYAGVISGFLKRMHGLSVVRNPFKNSAAFIKILLLVFLFSINTKSNAQGSCPCVYPGFLFRVPVSIYNTSGFPLNDYQVVLNVVWNSHMNADFSDLRFMDSTCTDLAYWVESYTNSTSATLWVKVPHIPAAGTTIHMFYGNISATSASNSQTTFVFFDRFDDNDYTNNPAWTVGGSTYTAASGYVEHTGSMTNFNLYAPINLQPTIGVMLEYDSYWTQTWCQGNEIDLDSLTIKTLEGFNEICDFGSSYNLSVTSKTNNGTINHPPTTNAWHNYKVTAFNGSYNIIYDNGVATVSTTGPAMFSADRIHIGGWQHYSGSRFDNIRLRQYAVPEPMFSFGSEESDTNLTSASITPTLDSICSGFSATITASAGLAYDWNTGDSTASITVNPLTTTSYTVTVTTASACSATAISTITVYHLPAVNAGADTMLCNGASLTLSGSGAATYSWDHGVTDGVPFTPLATTMYTVTGTDTNGCSATASVNISVTTLTVSIASSGTSVCQGDTITLTASGATTYSWTPAAGLSQPAIANPYAFPDSTTTYIVTGTTSGCSGTDTVTINVTSTLTVTATTVDSTLCSGMSVVLVASGATAYNWTPAATLSNPSTSNPLASPVNTTTYTVNGNSSGCTGSDRITVYVYPVPGIDAVWDIESCTGKNDAYINLTVSDGTPPYLISWNNGDTLSNLVSLSPGNYIVNVVDKYSCHATKSFTIEASGISCLAPLIYIPNIFSPNGDGINDVLYVRGNGIITMELIIYDRWGEKVFSATDPSVGWDGTFHEKLMVAEVYTYYLNAELYDNSKIIRKGTITLTR